MILHDLHCPTCDESFKDFPLRTGFDLNALRHWPCGTALQTVSGSRHFHAAVHASESCVVFRDANGKINYPGRNDVPTPAGMERVELRSFRELQQFSRAHNLHNEIEGYDSKGGTGRGFDSEPGYDGRPVGPLADHLRWQ